MSFDELRKIFVQQRSLEELKSFMAENYSIHKEFKKKLSENKTLENNEELFINFINMFVVMHENDYCLLPHDKYLTVKVFFSNRIRLENFLFLKSNFLVNYVFMECLRHR